MTQEKLLIWIDERLRERNWNDNQLAIKAGISPSVISKARSGMQPIGWESCKAIAHALGEKATNVLVLGNHLDIDDISPGESIDLEEWKFILEQLSAWDREELKQYARMKLERADPLIKEALDFLGNTTPEERKRINKEMKQDWDDFWEEQGFTRTK